MARLLGVPHPGPGRRGGPRRAPPHRPQPPPRLRRPLHTHHGPTRPALKKHLVHECDVAARAGSPLRIVYIRHAPGTWSGGEDVIDVYEVLTEELSVP
ncbi:hypothetical protein ACFZCG_38975 [Streptomyces tanashiensis]|uniref:hypothetical protein n=1 Tax=Streptomyces tanashiensis TaxID=67367 RepID=UPI0036EBA093